MSKLMVILRKAKIVRRLITLALALYTFAREISKAMKQETVEAKRKSLLEAFENVAKDIPWDLPGLLKIEFQNNNNGGN